MGIFDLFKKNSNKPPINSTVETSNKVEVVNKLHPINLDNGIIQVHPLRKTDLLKHDDIVNDLFDLFSNANALKFNKEKIVNDKNIVVTRLLGVS